MSDKTGINYPTVNLGGVDYEIKFTRATLAYRMSKANVTLESVFTEKNFSKSCDLLHALISPPFIGSPEDVAEFMLEPGKAKEVGLALGEALGKVFPPAQTVALKEPAGQETALPN